MVNDGNRVIRVYLAGPEVFLSDASDVLSRKKAICERWGVTGVAPIDDQVEPAIGASQAAALRVSRVNERLMRSCDAIISNLTPFRSTSADVGTAFELGFMRALGKQVLAYTNETLPYAARVEKWQGRPLRSLANGSREDQYGHLVEDYGLVDNLMLDGAVVASGYAVVVMRVSWERRFQNLRGFERCVQQLVERSVMPGVRPSLRSTVAERS